MRRQTDVNEDVEEEEPRSATARHLTDRKKKGPKVTDTRSQRKARMQRYVLFKPGERFSKGQWEVTKLIDNGGFGVVYEAWNKEKSMFAALKAEPTTSTGESQLKQEILVLRTVNPRGKTDHFPRIHSFSKHRNFAFIVMSLCGPNLKALRSCEMKQPRRQRRVDEKVDDHYLLSVSSWVRVAMQALYAIKTLHDFGFVHRDIKPANFVIGTGQDMTTIFMLDFGLSRSYAFKLGGKWIPRLARHRANFRGTARYCSPNMHDKLEQSRRDDLWSFFYILIEAHCSLPWQFELDRKELERIKCTISDAELTKNLPKRLRVCVSDLRLLDIYSRPDYAAIHRVLVELKTMNKISKDDPYDWEEFNEDYRRPADFISGQFRSWCDDAASHFSAVVVPTLLPAHAVPASQRTTERTTVEEGEEKRSVKIPTAAKSIKRSASIEGESKTDVEPTREPTRSDKRQSMRGRDGMERMDDRGRGMTPRDQSSRKESIRKGDSPHKGMESTKSPLMRDGMRRAMKSLTHDSESR